MTRWSDYFDDNYLDPNKWETIRLTWGDPPNPRADVFERNQRIEFDLYGNSLAAIVTRDRFDLTKGLVQAYLAKGDLVYISLLISPHKTYQSPRYALPDYYCIGIFYAATRVWKRKGGADPVKLYEGTPSAWSNVFKIAIEAGIIRFYEGTDCRAFEVYDLPSSECYVYLIGEYYLP